MKTMKKSEEIWNNIKDLKIELFGLKNQKVQDYCTFLDIFPEKCFLATKASALLPVLEELLHQQYDVDVDAGYITVSPKATKIG